MSRYPRHDEERSIRIVELIARLCIIVAFLAALVVLALGSGCKGSQPAVLIVGDPDRNITCTSSEPATVYHAGWKR